MILKIAQKYVWVCSEVQTLILIPVGCPAEVKYCIAEIFKNVTGYCWDIYESHLSGNCISGYSSNRKKAKKEIKKYLKKRNYNV